MQRMDRESGKNQQPELSTVINVEQDFPEKYHGFTLTILPTEKTGKHPEFRHNRFIEGQNIQGSFFSPYLSLRERLITVLNLSKKEFETPDACKIYPEKFMFGEEFEYWAPISESRAPRWVVNDLLILWESQLRDRIRDLDIPDTEYSIEKDVWTEDFLVENLRGICEKIEVRIGNWHCKGFRDSWNHQGLLEFNTSPYRLDQTFLVNGRTYTPYELFDLFIFSFCTTMNLEPSSGHKHVDFYESIGGNTEFLFRLLIDIEDKAWLCSAFDMEPYSSTSTKYVVQHEDAGQKVHQLKEVVSLYNSLLAEGYVHEKEEFYISLQKLRSFWACLTGDESRFVPVGLPRPQPHPNNAKAKAGEIVSRPTMVTAEFRFLNTPRDGNEARLLNEFLSEWLKNLNKMQINRTSINYQSYNPDKPQPKEKTVEMMEHFCTQELGLSPGHYKQILRI